MRWALKLGEVTGIGIYVHWTFSFLLLWVAFINIRAQKGVWDVAFALVLILAIFLCITLHELGHALAARRFGIKTRDITLLPIGGVARLERMPDKPMQEFWVAVAGPAVNVVIAAFLFAVLLLGSLSLTQEQFEEILRNGPSSVVTMLTALMIINVFLVLFNLLPAFPMDGGRILRALLATRIDYVRATQIAASIGQAMAILFGIWGVYKGQPMLLLVAFFVYLGAQSESHLVQMRSVFRGVPVREAMVTRFRSLSPSDSLSVAIGELLAGAQQDFPVLQNGQLIGILPRQRLLEALHQGLHEAPVHEVMEPNCEAVEDGAPLEDTFRRMQETGCVMMPVMRQGELVGFVTPENIGEWMMIRSAMKKQR